MSFIVIKMWLFYICSGRNYMYSMGHVHVCEDIVCARVIQNEWLVLLKRTSLKHSLNVLFVHIMYNQVIPLFLLFECRYFIYVHINKGDFIFYSFMCLYFVHFLPEWFDNFAEPFVDFYSAHAGCCAHTRLHVAP